MSSVLTKNVIAKEKNIFIETIVNSSVLQTWKVWTTKQGVKSFFAPDCKIEFEVGGAYEMYFMPDSPKGQKGGEGNKILAIQTHKMFSFTWNAPPHLPDVRNQRTHVTLRLEKLIEDNTKVTLLHDGWGNDGQWDEAFEYFKIAWGKVVIPRLKYRFDVGPVDWSKPPALD